jgi:hypothetical protein
MGNSHIFIRLLITFFAASLTVANAVSGQNCSVQGDALLSDISNGQVAVQLLNEAGDKILDFTLTDAQNKYAFENIPKGDFSLRLAQFGYQDTVYKINCPDGPFKFGPDTLYPLSIDIGEISVVEKAIVLQRRGDTTQVNFRVLERGYEQSLTDILESVPGLSLQNDRYAFEGKKINAVLVNGLNLSDRDQKGFTDGVFYQSVDKIQIIDNFSADGFHDLDSTTAQKAINIELNEAYQNRGQLSLKTEGGYKNTYHLRTNYLWARKNSGWRLNVNGLKNDAADQSDSYLSDYISRQQQDQLFATTYVPLRPFPVAQLVQVSDLLVESSTQESISVFYDARPQRKSRRLKGRMMIKRNNGTATLNGIRSYIDQPSAVSTFRQESPQSTEATGNIDFSNKLGKNGQFQFKMPIAFKENSLTGTARVFLENNSFNNSQTEAFKTISAAPTYQLRWSYSPGWQLAVFGRAEQSVNERNIAIASRDSIIIPSTFSQEDGNYSAVQQQRYRKQFYENQAQISYKKNGLYAVANLSSLIYNDKLNILTDRSSEPSFTGTEFWSLKSHTISLSARYDIKKFRFLAQSGITSYAYDNEVGKKQRYAFSPRLLLLYRMSRNYHLSGSYSEKINLPSLEQTTHLSIQQSQVALLTGDLTQIIPTLQRSFQLSLFKPVQVIEYPTLFNASVFFRPAYTQPQLRASLSGGFQRNTFENTEVEHEFGSNLFFSKSKREETFTLRAIANYKVFIHNENSVTDQFAMLNLSWRRNRMGRWGAQIGGQFSWFTRSIVNGIKNNNVNLTPELDITYTHKQTICKISQRYLFNDFGQDTNHYHRVDFQITKKKIFKNLEASFTAIDLLNFSNNNQVFSSFGQNYFETFSYNILPGRVLVGIKWYVN